MVEQGDLRGDLRHGQNDIRAEAKIKDINLSSSQLLYRNNVAILNRPVFRVVTKMYPSCIGSTETIITVGVMQNDWRQRHCHAYG